MAKKSKPVAKQRSAKPKPVIRKTKLTKVTLLPADKDTPLVDLRALITQHPTQLAAKKTKRGTPGRKVTLQILPPSEYTRMLQMVRLGASTVSIAGLFRVSMDRFNRWLSRGKEDKSGIYHRFYRDYVEAQTACRSHCELRVMSNDPKYYLERMAKTKEGEPGWNDPTKHDQQNQIIINNQNNQQNNLGQLELDPQTTLDALRTFEQLGMIKLTDEGRASLEAQAKSLEANQLPEIVDEETVDPDKDDLPEPPNPNPNTNGHSQNNGYH